MPRALYCTNRRLKRHKLLVSCAALAITVALTPQRAWAQAFQGTPTVTGGSVSFNRSTPGSETVTVSTGSAIVNWAPTDTQGTGDINFLPAGNTATFQGVDGFADFTILNRIVPTDATRAIELNGTVLSKLAGGATGGNVWFYSPGGILVGAQATFDVGGLLLTSIDLPNGFSNGTRAFSAIFSKTQPAAGPIKVLQGAQINARSSYVAMVAPRIEQGGNVQVNGSAAYVAADEATIVMSQGLFDIAVPVDKGTSDANGIVHTGTTGGPANTTASDNHTIYMVAVPKNQALAMLLNGSMGFAPAATNATVQNGQIILSAGSGLNGLGGTPPGGTPTGNAAAIRIGTQGPATLTSTTLGEAAGDTTLGVVTYSGALDLFTNGTLFADTVTGYNVVFLYAGGLVQVGGVVNAPQIFVTSSDIDIVADASLGVAGVTQLIAFNAMSDTPIYIGGWLTVPAGSYHIGDEAGDIRARTITINAEPANGGVSPDILIGNVNIDGSLTTGGGISSIIVDTNNGSIKVTGTVQWKNAGASDTLTLNAGKAVEVNTDTGSLVMTGPTGTLAGSLLFNAPNVWIAQGSILSQLEANPNFAGRDAALGINNGTSNPLGFVGANGINIFVTSSFFVQNSGTANDMGGITPGDRGLFIDNANSGTTPAAVAVTIYGRQLKSDGTVVTNAAFVPTVRTIGPIATGSTINAAAVGSAPPPPPPPPPPAPAVQVSETVLGPIQETVRPADIVAADPSEQEQQQNEKESDKKSENADSGVDASLGLINIGPVEVRSNLEQPVTSGGMETMDEGPGNPD